MFEKQNVTVVPVQTDTVVDQFPITLFQKKLCSVSNSVYLLFISVLLKKIILLPNFNIYFHFVINSFH